MKNATSKNSEFHNEQGWPPCALSLDRANLVSDFKIHHAPASELAEHGGICAACHAKAAKSRNRFESQDEHPADMSLRHKRLNPEQDHTAFNAQREVEQITDFEWSKLSSWDNSPAAADIREMDAGVRREVGIALSLIFAWSFDGGLKMAFQRWLILVAGIRPDLLDGASYKQIGEQLGGITKQALSKQALKVQDSLGLKFTRSRDADGRRNMAISTTASWNRRKTSMRPEPSPWKRKHITAMYSTYMYHGHPPPL